MQLIDVDEAEELTIRCRAHRSFDLTATLNRDTTGKNYRLQVKNHDDTILSFAVGTGLTILSQAVQLHKNPSDMDLPTGCYAYDLVEISSDGNAQNVLFGWFLIQPSYSQLP